MADDQPTVTQAVAVPQASAVPARLAAALGIGYEVQARVGSGGFADVYGCWTASSTAASP
jgi:hypothetical protein